MMLPSRFAARPFSLLSTPPFREAGKGDRNMRNSRPLVHYLLTRSRNTILQWHFFLLPLQFAAIVLELLAILRVPV
jgi:hypothetical protein